MESPTDPYRKNIEADRVKIPDKDNSALHIIAIASKQKPFYVIDAPNYDRIFDFEKLPAHT